MDRPPLALADPVLLHREHPLGPSVHPRAFLEQLFRIVRDSEEPLLQFPGVHFLITTPASSRFHLLVGEHGLALFAPVHLRALPVGESLLEHLNEQPLFPSIVLGGAGVDFPVPVVTEAHPFQLLDHLPDVLFRVDRGMHPALDGRVLGRHAEGIPAHRVENVPARHPPVAGQHVSDRVVANVSHVEVTARVRKHLHEIVLRLARILGDTEQIPLRPEALPLLFYLSRAVLARRHGLPFTSPTVSHPVVRNPKNASVLFSTGAERIARKAGLGRSTCHQGLGPSRPRPRRDEGIVVQEPNDTIFPSTDHVREQSARHMLEEEDEDERGAFRHPRGGFCVWP